ncbi:catalase [Candidimonas sp. SYP-B2681]|uniref:catalase n=1 Tax=Candidimonas sp. SYP-B2681 TaxID=2497686 RepID=UPI001F1AB811|nr:catalase [Candidimonas sp. SYP-B2681]
MRFFTNDRAAEMAGLNADFHRRDLFEAIARPWKLSVQIEPYADAHTYRYNPFDLKSLPDADSAHSRWHRDD